MSGALLRGSIAAVALFFTACGAGASTGVDFRGFFAGLDTACARSTEFEALQTSLSAKFGSGGDTAAPIAVPPKLASALGAVTTDDAGDHVRVNVALDGRYKGLKLSRLVFYFGKDNGIYGWAVEFDEPAERLRKTLGKAVARGNERLARENDTGASTGLDIDNGRVALFCDFSN